MGLCFGILLLCGIDLLCRHVCFVCCCIYDVYFCVVMFALVCVYLHGNYDVCVDCCRVWFGMCLCVYVFVLLSCGLMAWSEALLRDVASVLLLFVCCCC